jgi:uncharacterized protein with GYD domain
MSWRHFFYGEMNLLFITLGRFKKKPTKQMLAEIQRLYEQIAKQGGKILGTYWTLGRYDVVVLSECPDEKAHMEMAMKFAEMVSTESLVAVTAEEASKLVE